MRKAKRLSVKSLIFMLLITPAAAADISVAPDGSCTCKTDLHSWSCRKAIDYTRGQVCNAVAIAHLSCPQNKDELCTYSLQPTCDTLPTIAVCYPADEPQ